MSQVEFRFLQFVVSPVSDDRITIALLHWDGRDMRFAHSTARIPAALSIHRPALDRELKAIERQVRKLRHHSGNLLALTDVYRVTEGRGASLLWAPVRAGETKNAAAHFAELSALAALTPDARRDGGKNIREIKESLEKLGASLERHADGRVRTKMKVARRANAEHPYVSPLSWKNGKWNHTVPLSFMKQPSAMSDEVRWVMGLLHVDFPDNHKAVILALMPQDAQLAKRAREEADVIRDAGGSQVDVLTARPRERAKVLKALGDRIEREIASSASAEE